MQYISEQLQEILKSKLQAGATGFHMKVVLEDIAVSSSPVIVQVKFGVLDLSGRLQLDAAPRDGNTIVAFQATRTAGVNWHSSFDDFHPDNPVTPGSDSGSMASRIVGLGESSNTHVAGTIGEYAMVWEILGAWQLSGATSDDVTTGTPPATVDAGGPLSSATIVLAGYVVHSSDWAGNGFSYITPRAGWVTDGEHPVLVNGDLHPVVWAGHSTDGSVDTTQDFSTEAGFNFGGWAGMAAVLAARDVGEGGNAEVLIPNVKRISIDKSLRMTADQCELEFANEDLPLGWGPLRQIATNRGIRVYQWYGPERNAVRTFTGLVDKISDGRDVLTSTITLRDRMALLIDQTFSTVAPQASGETGAVRTEANGVFLSREVSYIVSAILDAAGWPESDRDISVTSYVVDEFLVGDGASWADTIIGDAQLTGLVGYTAWVDELGTFHFKPVATADSFTDPGDPVYTFRSGEDIVSLADSSDQYDLRTRVKARGPFTTTTLKDSWTLLWQTHKFSKPVGLWYDPTAPTIIRVLDRGTKRLYKLRQSDRAILSSSYLGGVITHPLGLSGDPSDSSIYWVLQAPWRDTGNLTGNRVKKVRKSDNHVLATYAIPNGRWSAIKVSANYVWLTNLDTDRFYKRSKSTLAAISSYHHVYNSVTQANPSGIMVDGTKLYLFWSNGGTTARFLVCDESAPTVITKVIKTAGTNLHGGEMDTTTHTECYGDSDSLGLVAKFTLVEPVSTTTDVATEVVNVALEDELGLFANMESRVHDAHPMDTAHPFEVRRETLDLKVITSIAQASQTAQTRLSQLDQRRRVVDTGILGNPALQKTDYVRVEDPVTGVAHNFVIDTYRTEMSASGTYLGTAALLPVTAVDDNPDTDPDGSE